MEKRPRLTKLELVCGIYLVTRHHVYKKEALGKRVFQVAENVDDLSCGILAYEFGTDAVMHVGYSTVKGMIPGMMEFARFAKCDFLEINCKKGHGGYRWMRVRPKTTREESGEP